MKTVISQQILGAGAVLATLGIIGEVGVWAIALGISLYISGVIIGQSGQ